ncbi:caspase-8-like [Protopterus annectens]|uniref:caspase-8-like n=1 Tax=Protopterus annectens TaxID=7888 RepID=UPI001CF9B734|nr:caspase-8-like [Protopterus annectens]
MGHRTMLLAIDGELGKDDVEALKFMCRDLLPLKRLSKVSSGIELFELLEKEDVLNKDDVFIVAELLYRIQQIALLKKIPISREEVVRHLPQKGRVSHYRQLLFHLSENITRDDLKAVKFLLQDQLPKCKLEENMTMLALLLEMEKQEMLTENNLDTLQNVCQIISQDLVKQINEYKSSLVTELPLPKQECQIHDNDVKMVGPQKTCGPPCETSSHEESSELLLQGENPSLQSSVGAETIPGTIDHMVTPAYRMNNTTRGYCVIINNYQFQMPLPPRKGSDTDADNLNRVFTWLGFEVLVYRDKTKAGILTIMREMKMKDHSLRDCFVCCVLTHGEDGSVYGTDAQLVSIREITAFFTCSECQTLTDKPKLFFIQACQGKESQQACFLQADARSSTTHTNEVKSIIPNEGDFLVGMATVPGYLSYRHIWNGTWYIQALCRHLRMCVPQGEDILSILTKVNSEVSGKLAFGVNTQMPEPRFTLRKRLIFPIPGSVLAEFEPTAGAMPDANP